MSASPTENHDGSVPGPEWKNETSIRLRKAIDGDRENLEWLVAHFYPLVRAQVRLRLGRFGVGPDDVQDVTNEVWLVTLARLRDLEPRNGRIVPVLVSFLGQTAVNLANDHLRRRARGLAHRTTESTPPLDEMAIMHTGVVTRAARQDLRIAVDRALDSLGDVPRHVLVLRLVEGKKNAEIAEILGLKPNTVAVQYRRAIDGLRAALPGPAASEILRFRR